MRLYFPSGNPEDWSASKDLDEKKTKDEPRLGLPAQVSVSSKAEKKT